MAWSEEDFANLQAKRAKRAVTARKPEGEPPAEPDGVKRWQALGRLPKGEMNKTEAAYAERLEQLKRANQIIDWKFHPMNIRLAKNTFYEVDFLVLHADMTLAIHETKGGYTSEKGQLKIKLVAELMPWFRFYKVEKLKVKQGGGFHVTEFNP